MIERFGIRGLLMGSGEARLRTVCRRVQIFIGAIDPASDTDPARSLRGAGAGSGSGSHLRCDDMIVYVTDGV